MNNKVVSVWHGFTLVELMIVVAVISVLAGLLLPVVGSVRRQAKEVEDLNNLRQIGSGLALYRISYSDSYGNPPSLSFLLQPGEDMATSPKKILRSPVDPTRGRSNNLNRPASWEQYWDSAGRVAQIIANEKAYGDVPVSYFYECSGVQFPGNQGWFDSFFPLTMDAADANQAMADLWSRRYVGRVYTWGEYKRDQLKMGKGGRPWNESRFPIVRSFWHEDWKATSKEQQYKMWRVATVFWDTSVRWTIPYWETGYMPQVFTPQDSSGNDLPISVVGAEPK